MKRDDQLQYLKFRYGLTHEIAIKVLNDFDEFNSKAKDKIKLSDFMNILIEEFYEFKNKKP